MRSVASMDGDGSVVALVSHDRSRKKTKLMIQ